MATRRFVEPETSVFEFRIYGMEDVYPPVPLRMFDAKKIRLPELPGVYFFWGDSHRVLYVGKARDLSKRVKLKQHHVLKDWHGVSYLMMTSSVIAYAEAYYISMLRPPLNIANFFQPAGGGSYAKQLKGHLPYPPDTLQTSMAVHKHSTVYSEFNSENTG